MILTRQPPTSPGRASRMSAAMRPLARMPRTIGEPGVPALRSSSPYASARLNTNIVLTRPGTGAIVEPTWRALCVR